MWKWVKNRVANIYWRQLLSDTAARVIFSVVTGMLIEVVGAGMSIRMSLISRAVAQPTTAATAGFYGWSRDKILAYFGVTKEQWIRWSIINIVYYAIFYCTQYALIRYYIIGATAEQTWIATGILAAASLPLGILFGLWLDLVRKLLKARPPTLEEADAALAKRISEEDEYGKKDSPTS